MTTPSTRNVVAEIHDSPWQIVLAVTGGGSQAIADLFRVPGASGTMLEAVVPYSANALDDYLGAPCEQYCAPETARAMAMVALERAMALTAKDTQVAGVACTATLASNSPKRGAHRIHVAVQTIEATQTVEMELAKGKRSRLEEEHIAGNMIIDQIAKLCDCSESVTLELTANERLETRRTDAPDDWQQLLTAEIDATCLAPELDESNEPPPGVVFPGAFNPFHDGHRQMANVAASILAATVEFELSIANVDKPLLDYTTILDRTKQFTTGDTLWLTRAATFLEKSHVFPAATFVVGADTIARIADPRYYGGDDARRNEAIETIKNNGCRFLVFGRLASDGFRSLSETMLPPGLADLCQEVPEEQFRADISSTEMRKL